MKKNKPEIVPLSPQVSMWRRNYGDGIVTVYNDSSVPITLERVNFLLDKAKEDLLKNG